MGTVPPKLGVVGSFSRPARWWQHVTATLGAPKVIGEQVTFTLQHPVLAAATPTVFDHRYQLSIAAHQSAREIILTGFVVHLAEHVGQRGGMVFTPHLTPIPVHPQQSW